MSDEITYAFGWTPSAPDHRDYQFHPGYALGDLPPTLDLDAPSPGVPFDPSLNQLSLGACGPNTAVEDIVFRALLAGATHVALPSRLFIYYNTRYLMNTVASDSGVNNRAMLKALKQYGYCPEALWPYDVGRFTERPPDAAYQAAAAQEADFTYLAVQQNLGTMKAALADQKPIIFGFTVYESMLSAQVRATGDVPMPGRNESSPGGHDVLLTGWDDQTQRFKFKNHWGTQWGRQGYGTIPYAYALNPNLSGDFWLVVNSGLPAPPKPPAPAPGPVPVPPPPPSPPIPLPGQVVWVDLQATRVQGTLVMPTADV